MSHKFLPGCDILELTTLGGRTRLLFAAKGNLRASKYSYDKWEGKV